MTYEPIKPRAHRGRGAMILKRAEKGKATVEKEPEPGNQESRIRRKEVSPRESDRRLRGLVLKLARAEAQ